MDNLFRLRDVIDSLLDSVDLDLNDEKLDWFVRCRIQCCIFEQIRIDNEEGFRLHDYVIVTSKVDNTKRLYIIEKPKWSKQDLEKIRNTVLNGRKIWKEQIFIGHVKSLISLKVDLEKGWRLNQPRVKKLIKNGKVVKVNGKLVFGNEIEEWLEKARKELGDKFFNDYRKMCETERWR